MNKCASVCLSSFILNNDHIAPKYCEMTIEREREKNNFFVHYQTKTHAQVHRTHVRVLCSIVRATSQPKKLSHTKEIIVFLSHIQIGVKIS